MVFAAAAVLANIMPRFALGVVARIVTYLRYAFDPAKRRNVRDNLEGLGLRPDGALVRSIFRLHTTNIIELIASSRWRPAELEGRFEIEGENAIERALAEGKGVILVTQHTGSWETGALCLRAMGCRLHVVAGVQLSRFLTGAAKEAKERHGIEVINPEDPPRRLLKALAGGGVLALLVDGNVYTGGAEVVFFGRKVLLPDGPVRLSRVSGAPVVAGYCRRRGSGRYLIHTEYVAGAEELRAMSDGEALARIYGAVERCIGRNADQWIMFRRFWESPR